jgi:phosphoglycerate kinase
VFYKKTIKDIEVREKRVLVRVDFNVPIKDGEVADDTRIRSALPTIRYLLDQMAVIILCSHLGRPKGERKPEFSLKPVAELLRNILDSPVHFGEDCIGGDVKAQVEKLQPGDVIVLENTRFHPGEKTNDPKMAQELASLADVFVNDAFGTAHRAHASNVGVANYLPAVAGFLMESEIRYLGGALSTPKRPLIAILGGAKVSDKIDVIRNLLSRADSLLIGGGMANTFFKAQGYSVGDSLVEDDSLETAREILKTGQEKLRLPVDVVIGKSFDPETESKTIYMGSIPDGWRILDVGPETIKGFAKDISNAKTVVWNGPMGVFEFPKFAQGTFGLAKEIANIKTVSIIGGGDSVAAINQMGLADQVTHISTGGGAFLELLEGKILPGLAALDDKGE